MIMKNTLRLFLIVVILHFAFDRLFSQTAEENNSHQVPELIFVKGNKFIMGDHLTPNDNAVPEHEVKLNSFYIGKYEVTNEEFCAFMNDYGFDYIKDGPFAGKKIVSEFKHGIQKNGNMWEPVGGYEKYPVANVSWYGAKKYCDWLSQKTGENYRLPTEAEWEYAAGWGETRRKPFPGTFYADNLKLYAWYGPNSDSISHPVGTKEPNELGVYDMAGNVYEWCSDFFDEDYYSVSPKKNPQGPESGTKKVARGGCFYINNVGCLVSYRGGSDPDYIKAGIIGFRICKDK